MPTKTKKSDANSVAKKQVTKNKVIIAKKPTAFRKIASMLKKYEAGMMPVGTAYEIVLEVKNGAGTFYKLNNGMYITSIGHYTIINQ